MHHTPPFCRCFLVRPDGRDSVRTLDGGTARANAWRERNKPEANYLGGIVTWVITCVNTKIEIDSKTGSCYSPCIKLPGSYRAFLEAKLARPRLASRSRPATCCPPSDPQPSSVSVSCRRLLLWSAVG